MPHIHRSIGNRLSAAIWFVPLSAFVLMFPSSPVATAQQQSRAHVPGTAIVAAFRATPQLLQTFSSVQVVAVLKNGKSPTVRFGGNAGEVRISTFGVEASPEEIKGARTVANAAGRPALYGVEDQDGEWHGFDDIERLVIRHLRNTTDKAFDGYENEVRVTWKAKAPDAPGYEISYRGGMMRFGDTIQGQLATRLIGRRIAFVLDSPSGASALRPEQEKVNLAIGEGSAALKTFSGGEEVILPEGTRVARCQLTGGTEQRFTMDGNCQWTWSPDQGPAKIVLLRRDPNAPITTTPPLIPAGPATQPLTRVHAPGTPIVTTFRPAGDLLQTFSGIQVVAVLKTGKSLTVRSRGNAGEVRIDTFGVQATPQEIALGRTVPDNSGLKKPTLFGVEDQEGEWYGFDDIERFVIKHFRNTADKTFDGYEYDVRVAWKAKMPDTPGFEISHSGRTASFGTAIEGQFGTRLIGRRITFVLESPSGPPALHAEREKVSLSVADTGSTPRTASGGEEVILPDSTRIARCQLTGGTEERFTMDGNCATWTWAPDQGPAKIVLLGKDANLTISYDREGSIATPRIGSLSVYLTKANGNLVQAPAQQGAGDSISVKGTTTMTSAAVTLTGDPNFEDLDSVEVPLDGTKLKLLRRRPGVVVVLDAGNRLNPVRELVVAQITKAVDELSKSPIARKFTMAIAQEEGYQVIGDIAKTRETFAAYRIDSTSFPQPRQALPRAQRDALKYNEAFPAIKNRVVYIVPSDPTLDVPWRDVPPYDSSKVDLFVIEVGLNGAQAWIGKFLEPVFGGNFSSRYRFVKTPDELSRSIVEFATH